MKQIPRVAALIAGAAVLASTAGCGTQQSEDSTISTLTTSVAAFSLSGNWNPETSSYINTITLPPQAVYETFIQLDPATFTWEPLLAESYEIAEDQRSMRIKLREDVDFTDGTHFDAEAAAASFRAALRGDTNSSLALREQYSTEIEVTGEYEVVVTADGAMGTDFLFWFGIVPMASPTALEEDPIGLETMPVGTGPYVLTEQTEDLSVSFERNPDYRNPEAYAFDELTFVIYDDPVAVSNALKAGQLDAAQVEPQYAADLESSGFTLHTGVGGHSLLVWMDPQGEVSPPIADVRVRQAIAYAIDRAGIVENIEYGFGFDTSQSWGKGSPYYIEGADDTYDYNPDKARELLAEAGYQDGFEFTMLSTGKYDPVLQQMLADIGITVNFDLAADVADAGAAIDGGVYPLVWWTTSDLFFSDRMRRIPHGGIPEITALYEVIDNGTTEEAADAAREIGQLVLDDAIAIPTSRTSSIWASVPEITVEMPIVNWGVILAGIQTTD